MPSIAFLAATVISFVIAAKLASGRPLFAMILAFSAIPLLAILIHRAGSQSEPMIPVDLVGQRSIAVQAGAAVCCFIGQSIGLVALPFHLQATLSHDLLTTGLIISCWPMGVACTSLVAGRLMRGLEPGAQCMAGGVILGAGLLMLASIPSTADVFLLAAGAAVCGVGFGLFQLANNHTLFLTALAERAAAAGGLQGTARLVGQTAGTMIMALIFVLASGDLAPRAGFAAASVFALAAALLVAAGTRRAGITVSAAVEGGV